MGEAIIYGLSLEQSESRGLMYHMIGVNGAAGTVRKLAQEELAA